MQGKGNRQTAATQKRKVSSKPAQGAKSKKKARKDGVFVMTHLFGTIWFYSDG
jgi:hypothetical protein